VSGTTLTFWNAYRGNQSGGGQTLVVMGPNPVNGSTGTGDLMYFNGAFYWEMLGINSKGAYAGGAWLVTNSRVALRNIEGFSTATSGPGADSGLSISSQVILSVRNFVFGGGRAANIIDISSAGSALVFLDGGYMDGSTASLPMLRGIYTNSIQGGMIAIKDVHIDGCTAGIEHDVSVTTGHELIYRNITFSNNTADIDVSADGIDFITAAFEDFEGTLGDNRFFSSLSTSETAASWVTDTSTVRSGGSSTSIKLTPSIYVGPWHLGEVTFLGQTKMGMAHTGIPIYADASAKTYSLYVKTAATSNWTANPTADELFLEVEYLAHSSNTTRSIKRSTGTVNFTGSTDWQSISITVTPGQAGLLYLRAIYRKTKESSKSNEIFVDPIPVVS
jgi:hypothetical protein